MVWSSGEVVSVSPGKQCVADIFTVGWRHSDWSPPTYPTVVTATATATFFLRLCDSDTKCERISGFSVRLCAEVYRTMSP